MTHRVESQIHCEVPRMIPSSNDIVGNDKNLQTQDLLPSENFYKCDQCDAILTRTETFFRHMRRHIEGKTWECDQCTVKFASRDDLLQHYRYHYKGGKRFECMVDSCNSIFTTFQRLITHLEKDHVLNGSLCKLCSRPFKTKRQYFYHLMKNHREHAMVCRKNVNDSHCQMTQQIPMVQEQLEWQQLVNSVSPNSTLSDDSGFLPSFHENEESDYTISMASDNSLTPSPIGFESAFPQPSFFSNSLFNGILSNNNNNSISTSICANSCDKTIDCMQNANTSSPIQSHTSEDKVCPHCEMTFDNSILYLVHLFCHCPNEPFKCGLCGVQLEDKQTFHDHLAFVDHT